MIDSPLSPHGGYRDLLPYQRSEIIYDATAKHCRRFYSKLSSFFAGKAM